MRARRMLLRFARWLLYGFEQMSVTLEIDERDAFTLTGEVGHQGQRVPEPLWNALRELPEAREWEEFVHPPKGTLGVLLRKRKMAIRLTPALYGLAKVAIALATSGIPNLADIREVFRAATKLDAASGECCVYGLLEQATLKDLRHAFSSGISVAELDEGRTCFANGPQECRFAQEDACLATRDATEAVLEAMSKRDLVVRVGENWRMAL